MEVTSLLEGALAPADVMDGLALSATTLGATALLEVTSLSAVRGLLQQRGGAGMYLAGVAMNFVNLATGTLAYAVFTPHLCTLEPLRLAARAWGVLGLLAVHAVLYWAAHKLMYTPRFYWMHRFHHRFNKHVFPSAANAMMTWEFLIAYTSPLIVGGSIFAVDRRVVQVALGFNYLGSVLVHTPWLQGVSGKIIPWFLVSTDNDMEHHRLLTSHFASPTLNVDSLVIAVLLAFKGCSDMLLVVKSGSWVQKYEPCFVSYPVELLF